jgi:MFS family permease
MIANRFRWFVVFLLFVVTVINYIDRSAIAFAAHLIQKDFGLSSAQIGLVLGAFGIGYIVSTLFGGMSVDRFGSKVTLGLTVLIWTIAIGWTGAAIGFVMLYAARIALGLAEGPSFPAVTGAVEEWLTPKERASALAGVLVAVPIALAIGSPVVSLLIAQFGWHTMFYILAVLGLLWLPIWMYFFSDKPEKSRFVGDRERSLIDSQQNPKNHGSRKRVASAAEWKALLTTPTLLANYWAYFVFGYFLFFFMSWMPEFLRKSYDLKLAQVGFVAILPWAASAIALYGFGRWSDVLLRRTSSLRIARSYQIAGTQIVAAIAIVPVAMFDNIYVAVAGITVAVAASMAANAAYYAVITDLVPRLAGTAMGIMTIWFAASGFLAPVITGYALDLTGNFAPAFWLVSVLAASSVVGVVLLHQPDRDQARLKSVAG